MGKYAMIFLSSHFNVWIQALLISNLSKAWIQNYYFLYAISTVLTPYYPSESQTLMNLSRQNTWSPFDSWSNESQRDSSQNDAVSTNVDYWEPDFSSITYTHAWSSTSCIQSTVLPCPLSSSSFTACTLNPFSKAFKYKHYSVRHYSYFFQPGATQLHFIKLYFPKHLSVSVATLSNLTRAQHPSVYIVEVWQS